MRPSRRVLAALAGGTAALACAAPAAASIQLSAQPRLTPAFSTKIKDYAIRCAPGEPVRVSVRASDGDRVKVADKKTRGGTFERKVEREAGKSFRIRVRAGGASSTHHVRCLPPRFPVWSFQRTAGGQAQWYVIAPVHHAGADFMVVVDSHGTPVWWWLPSPATYGPVDGKLLPDGTLAWARWYGDHFGVGKSRYEVRRPDGSLVRFVRTVGSPTDTHDMQMLPNGNYLVNTFRRRCCEDLSSHGGPSKADVFDGEIQEITPGGRRVWRWNTKDHIPTWWTTGDEKKGVGWWALEMSATPNRPPAERAYDLVHLNSVEVDPPSRGAGGDGLIVSARHIDSVFRIDRATGEIDWKLGGRHVPGKSLKVLGQHQTPLFSGQHDARLWKDGSLTVYDNGSYRDRAPEADRFVIDPAKRTARLVERIRNPKIGKSNAVGSARKLARGNWVIDWGGNAYVTEQREDGSIVREIKFLDGRGTSRAVPIEKGELNAARLRRGMGRMSAAHRGVPR